MINLINKRIVLGITGGIAAYKCADLVRRLKEAGADVRVVMTEHAKAFITPTTLQALSGHPVHDDLFDPEQEAAMGHIALARWADVILIAPATANFLAKLTHGEADNLLLTLCLASAAPLAIAPAMNQQMWHNTTTQANVTILNQRGIRIIGPAQGEQACGDVGYGRMQEPLFIAQRLNDMFATGALAGQHVVITAGPTQEAIDPVRYLTNRSSGKMGYALAVAAVEAGAKVTLISGPCALTPPERVRIIHVISAQDMLNAVHDCLIDCDIFIAAAAVADYRCADIASQKVKKSSQTWQINLVPNPDILASVASTANKPFCVGFAAETDNVITYAKQKLANKSLDMIVANDVSDPAIGFDSDENAVTVITHDDVVTLAQTSKIKIARDIIQQIGNQQHLKRKSA